MSFFMADFVVILWVQIDTHCPFHTYQLRFSFNAIFQIKWGFGEKGYIQSILKISDKTTLVDTDGKIICFYNASIIPITSQFIVLSMSQYKNFPYWILDQTLKNFPKYSCGKTTSPKIRYLLQNQYSDGHCIMNNFCLVLLFLMIPISWNKIG